MKFNYLKIEEEKKEEIKKICETRSLKASIEETLRKGKTPIIAEVKKTSPSLGKIRDINILEAALKMEEGGACAISVLTDKHFNGRICDLRQVKNAVNIPVLRKDFIVDIFQLYESRGNGADAVLLITSLLKEKTKEFVRKTNELGMEALVEVHDVSDLEYALSSDAELIGINNRNLKTLKTDLSITEHLAPEIPEGYIIISESGIETTEEIQSLKKAGAHAFLIGTSIMKSPEIREKVNELTNNRKK